MTSARSLYLPVEGLARELDAKLLMAVVARERGWQPLFGNRGAVYRRCSIMPAGVVQSNNARGAKPALFRKLAKFGHQPAVLDEEGLVRQTDEIFLMKHEKEAFADVSQVLTWGEDDAELWRRSGQVDPARVVVTGNPRMDVLRPDVRSFHQPEIDAIRARFGDYLLMNTNFATVNNFIPRRSTLVLAGWATETEADAQRIAFLAHKRALFERFLALVPKLAAAIAPVRLVVRPHPSESHDPWVEAVAGAPNVSVVFEGSVVPWIAGARALVHNGCTSAVESAVIGTTVLTYRPVQSEPYDNPLPNGLGIECLDDDALIAAAQEILASGPRPLTPDQSKLLEHHVAATSGRLSCDRILDAFEALPDPALSAPATGRLEWLRRYLKVRWREAAMGISRSLKGRGKIRTAYADRIFPETAAEYLNDRIARYQTALGRFEGRRARRVGRNLFTID